MKLEIRTDMATDELSENLYSVVGERFPVNWSTTGKNVLMDTDRTLTNTEIQNFLDEVGASEGRTIDGIDLSDESRKKFIEDIDKLTEADNQRLHCRWFEMITGKSVQAEADRLGLTINLEVDSSLFNDGGLL